jgi:hypothetical protein
MTTASTTNNGLEATLHSPRMTVMDTEVLLGIGTYRTPSVPGFSGVVKGRFSDFVVHEVILE